MPGPDLLELATAVSDGRRVDWEARESGASTSGERSIVRNLRLVEALASAGRCDDSTTTLTETTVFPADAAPRVWGGLELRGKLGQGAFGEVFLAWDPQLQREVALKLFGTRTRPDLRSRVLDEGRLLARVSHANVVTVHGVGEHGSSVGLWMELVRGRSLDALLVEHGRLGAREAAMIGIDLCRALAAVHGAGLVHRDVKAANVMREEGGRVLLMDFGAGREAKRSGEDRISGTPLYIAPEVWAGEAATARSDLWSVGVLLYHLVTGAYPIESGDMAELREKLARRETRLLRDARPDLSEPFLRVVERALAWEPGERFATAGRMEQALAATLGTETPDAPAAGPATPPSRGRRIAIALALAGTLGALALWVALRETGWRMGAVEPYTVAATLYRVPPQGAREELEPGGRIEIGDRIALDFRTSRSVHLYVINEDEQGHAFLLFPLPGFDAQNPLQPGSHAIPGTRGGRSTYWTANSAGERSTCCSSQARNASCRSRPR